MSTDFLTFASEVFECLFIVYHITDLFTCVKLNMVSFGHDWLSPSWSQEAMPTQNNTISTQNSNIDGVNVLQALSHIETLQAVYSYLEDEVYSFLRIDMIPYISPYICTYMQYAYIAFSLMLFVFYYYSINDILDLVDFQFTGLGSKIEIFAQVPVILPQWKYSHSRLVMTYESVECRVSLYNIAYFLFLLI